MIEILTSGALNSVQDQGRRGYLALGVSHCGAMDQVALAMGNALLGNAPGSAAIEIAFFPFRMRLLADMSIAVTGADCGATVDGVAMPPCWARAVFNGQILTIARPTAGARAYICVTGGIDVPLVMGSRSTDLKTGFGGFSGRGLVRGDRVTTFGLWKDSHTVDIAGFGGLPPDSDGESETGVTDVRILPAAEHDLFEIASLQDFVGTDWKVSPEANRMGYRLDGPKLALTRKLELLSHGILPGTVQVPPSGQPIIQLADANTCGGYPKIATVIEADLWKLAQAAVGSRIRFVATNRDTAIECLRLRAAWLADLRAMAKLVAG